MSGGRIGLLKSFNGWIAGGAHNAYVEILLALGLAGSTVLFLLLWKTYFGLLRYLFRNWNPLHPAPEAVVALKVLAILASLTVEGLFESGFCGPPRFEATIFLGTVFCADQIRSLDSTLR